MDFELFYDKQPDYVSFRNDAGRREDYSITVDWKVRKLIQLMPEGFKVENILEVGCAFGVLLNDIADRLHLKNRLGIDISGNNIEAAKNFIRNVNSSMVHYRISLISSPTTYKIAVTILLFFQTLLNIYLM